MQDRGVVLHGRSEDKGRRQHLAVRLDRHDEHPEQREQGEHRVKQQQDDLQSLADFSEWGTRVVHRGNVFLSHAGGALLGPSPESDENKTDEID